MQYMHQIHVLTSKSLDSNDFLLIYFITTSELELKFCFRFNFCILCVHVYVQSIELTRLMSYTSLIRALLNCHVLYCSKRKTVLHS